MEKLELTSWYEGYDNSKSCLKGEDVFNSRDSDESNISFILTIIPAFYCLFSLTASRIKAQN